MLRLTPQKRRLALFAASLGLSLSTTFAFVNSALAVPTQKDVVISEVAWMGTATSTSDEWIELHNNTTGDINLNGWTLQAADGTPTIPLSGIIPANGSFLLERTDDTTIPGLAADLIFTGALGNTGEGLTLTDAGGTLQDELNATWNAGDNTTKAAMERVDTLADGTLTSSWANGSADYGPGLGYGTPTNAAATTQPPPPPQFVDEPFTYDLKFAGGLAATTVTDIYSTPSSSSDLPMAIAMLDRINAAIGTIDFSVYGFRNQCAFINALSAAQARGVVVRGHVDQESDGSFTYTDGNGCDTQAMINTLGAQWVKVDLNPSTGYGYSAIMHNKFFIIDNAWVSVGSTNYSDTGIGGEYNANWNMLINSANLASAYSVEFDEMWVDELSHNNKTDNTTHVLPAYTDGTMVESYFAPTDDAMNNAIIPAINTADSTLDVTIFYLTSQEIVDAMLAAKNRGVNVRVILDATGAGNLYSKHDQLCTAGIPVKIENWNGKMHMKALVADGDNMIIGSQNFTGAGNTDNDENTLWIKGGDMSQISADFLVYFNNLWNSIPEQFNCNNPGAESLNVGSTCYDGADNDYDGFIDMADSGCSGTSENTLAVCTDGMDNDGDTYIDADDFDCWTVLGLSHEDTQAKCTDGIDNDGDGYIDSQDYDCWPVLGLSAENNTTACSDGVDNDGDGYIDGTDFDCAGVTGLPSETGEAVCNDGVDNDGDNKKDARDSDCPGAPGGNGNKGNGNQG